MWSSPCRRDGEVEKSALLGGYILSSLRGEDRDERWAFFNGKEGFCPLEGEPKGVLKTIEGRFSKNGLLGSITEK